MEVSSTDSPCNQSVAAEMCVCVYMHARCRAAVGALQGWGAVSMGISVILFPLAYDPAKRVVPCSGITLPPDFFDCLGICHCCHSHVRFVCTRQIRKWSTQQCHWEWVLNFNPFLGFELVILSWAFPGALQKLQQSNISASGLQCRKVPCTVPCLAVGWPLLNLGIPKGSHSSRVMCGCYGSQKGISRISERNCLHSLPCIRMHVFSPRR